MKSRSRKTLSYYTKNLNDMLFVSKYVNRRSYKLIPKITFIELLNAYKKSLKQNNILYHKMRSYKALADMAENGELDDFKHDLKEERNGKKLFNIKDAF